MDHEAWDEPTNLDEPTGPELVDLTTPAPMERTWRITPRLGLSVPGAIGGVLLIGAIAFGANLGLVGATNDDVRPTATSPAAALVEEPYEEPAEEADPTKAPEERPDPTAKPTEKAYPTEKAEPTHEAEPTPKAEKPDATPEPTKKPEPKAEPKEKPDPTPKPVKKPVMSLALDVREGAILIDWGGCEVDGAQAYKVVRSYNSTVKWPASGGDDVIAVVEMGGQTKAWDEHAKAGAKTWYRVFCVRKTDDGYKVLAATAAKSIVAPKREEKPEPTPKPEPCAMALELGVDGGAVVLHWEACGSDGFSHYRILRKVDGEPTLLAEAEGANNTTFVDHEVEAGVTYHYAVQAKGHIGDEWILLGTTDWVSVVVE